MDAHDVVIESIREHGFDAPPKPSQGQGRSETSTIPKGQEAAFQSWVKRNGVNDLDVPGSFYDYRGAYLAGVNRSDNGHFPDTFKQHGHPTFSVESRYSKGPDDGGRWNGETFVAPPVWRMLQRTGNTGLLDTLLTIAGKGPSSLSGQRTSAAWGEYWPAGGSMGIDTTLGLGPKGSKPSAANVLAHEFGHFVHNGGSEPEAEVFARAVMGLRNSAKDTTYAGANTRALELGISPLLPRTGDVEPVDSGMVQNVMDNLLKLPIFSQHPLNKGVK